jgi:alpha-beta hydrolase superfamily lysophospholipase
MADVADRAHSDPAQAKRLVVVVPSIHDRFEPWDGLIKRLKTLPGYDDATCDWRHIHHGADFRHRGRAMDFGAELAANVNQQWVAAGGYEDVVLVGHSLGGVFVRYAYLHALGTFDPTDRRPWAEAVERVVLFASLNRGVEVSFKRRWWLPVVAGLGRFLPVTRHWLAYDLLRGADFIANLRIAWLREINSLSRPPLMVQYLGRSDSLVGEEDSRDIDTFATGTQELVPDATHGDLIRLDTAPDPDARFALIARAFTDPQLEGVALTGDPEQRVVIVLHGIRASNDDWPRDLERLIEAKWPGTEVIAATYGRFSARKFVIPATRRKYLSWMQDTYAERLAANPRATFHFLGHSNGTYLLGHSLEHVPAMRFERILLAGSVLPTTYDWQGRVADAQVHALRNDRAARDVPVGVLCSGLRGLLMRDVGTGGVDGFRWEDPIKTETYYYKGGHGAALTPANLPRLAAYVMDGANNRPKDLVREPSSRFSLLSRAAPYLAWFLVLALLAAATAAIWLVSWPHVVTAAVLIGVAFTLLVILDII